MRSRFAPAATPDTSYDQIERSALPGGSAGRGGSLLRPDRAHAQYWPVIKPASRGEARESVPGFTDSRPDSHLAGAVMPPIHRSAPSARSRAATQPGRRGRSRRLVLLSPRSLPLVTLNLPGKASAYPPTASTSRSPPLLSSSATDDDGLPTLHAAARTFSSDERPVDRRGHRPDSPEPSAPRWHPGSLLLALGVAPDADDRGRRRHPSHR